MFWQIRLPILFILFFFGTTFRAAGEEKEGALLSRHPTGLSYGIGSDFERVLLWVSFVRQVLRYLD